ncbi:glycine-rich domain-containing protein [Pseudonocardia lacus]|uniref:glycine-rich domain-containing protein n=1 Tax=Pseudonocardia lacus TaxID=2835865 RepID=UPI001BDD65A6|nr:hypothetical protein [Pseudonocardia lacus]
MILPLTDLPPRAADPQEALDYDGSFVVDKLLRDHVVDCLEEGRELFDEVKKFLVLVQSDPDVAWEMYSTRVDEAWHQFILFTAEYMTFCYRFFGKYLPHSPHRPGEQKQAPAPSARTAPMSFAEFGRRYEAKFGVPLPDHWRDRKNITTTRRLFSDRTGRLTLREDAGTVDLLDGDEVLLSVNPIARDALAFVARTGVFYVRELPGGLDDEEQVALATALAEAGVLRVGA